MNNAKAVERLGEASKINLLVLDGNPERFSQSDASDFANRGLNYAEWPWLGSGATPRATVSPLNWSRHNYYGSQRAHYSGRDCLVQCARPNTTVKLGDSNFFRKIDVLNCVQQFDAFIHRTLKGLASGNQAHAAAALIDDGGAYGFSHVAGAF